MELRQETDGIVAEIVWRGAGYELVPLMWQPL